MMSICSRYERNRQDAVAKMNISFLKVLNNLEHRSANVPFELWVRRIIINTVIDKHRSDKKRKSHEVLTGVIEETNEGEVNGYLEEMESEEFAEMLQQLPDKTGQVFNLYAIDGYSHAEIAELLGMSEGTSRWHVSHARRLLQEAIMKSTTKNLIQTR